MRTGCRPDACDFFALLDDSSRVSANLAEQAFDGHVKSHMADWSNGAGVSPPTSPTSVVVRPATKLFFLLDSQHQYHGLRAGYSCCVTAAAVTAAA